MRMRMRVGVLLEEIARRQRLGVEMDVGPLAAGMLVGEL
jgi:hypothetical protein